MDILQILGSISVSCQWNWEKSETIFLRMIDKVRWISHFIIKWSLSSTSSWHIVFTWHTHIFIWRRTLAVTLLVQSDNPDTIVLVDVLIPGGRIFKVIRMILWTRTVIRAASTFVGVYFPDILCFAITSSILWCESIYWLRNTSVATYFCSKYDQGFSDGFHGLKQLNSWTLDFSSRNCPWFPGRFLNRAWYSRHIGLHMAKNMDMNCRPHNTDSQMILYHVDIDNLLRIEIIFKKFSKILSSNIFSLNKQITGEKSNLEISKNFQIETLKNSNLVLRLNL